MAIQWRKMFDALVETLAQFLATEDSSTHSKTLSDKRFKALVEGLAGTLL